MAKRYPHRPRRRPGRRPPYRPRAGVPTPRGYTVAGVRQVVDALLPLEGRERRRFFNTMSASLVVSLGLGGALLGGSWGGPVGAVVGFGAGVAAGGRFVERRRFFRR